MDTHISEKCQPKLNHWGSETGAYCTRIMMILARFLLHMFAILAPAGSWLVRRPAVFAIEVCPDAN